MENNIEVSIYCTAYNAEKYIGKCLESIVSQKTNFDFLVIVHDDCSTDGTLEIILQYEKMYPDKILVITEEENQYSKGVNVLEDIMRPYVVGKYIAFCEGDDYWTDDYKLQKQYDFMEENKEFTMCVHNTIIHDLLGKMEDQCFAQWNERHILTYADVLASWCVHTSSYFIRNPFGFLPEKLKKYRFGDYVMLTTAMAMGNVMFLPEIMSVYNANNEEGVTFQINSLSKKIHSLEQRIKYLVDLNEFSDGKYEQDIFKAVEYFKMQLSKIHIEILNQIN